jgi:hypothetical protein
VPISRPNVEHIGEADLLELVTAGTSEGLLLDFKRETYGSSDADRRELLKDVSAFANAQGGHIVIGIEESQGVAAAVPGIQVADIDAEVIRIGQIVRGGLDPHVHGVAIRSIALQSGSHCIVVRVPRSWRAPHRVSAQGSNRYWVRNSSGCHEASVDELRVLFGQSHGALEGARRFRNERIELIRRADGQRPLVGEGRLIFHIVPQSALFSSDTLDPQAIYKKHSAFAPISSTGMSPRFNFEGVINDRGGENNHGYTQIFRTGIVEATKASVLRRTNRVLGIPGSGLEGQFFERYESYINGLKALAIQPPLILMITLEGVKGARYFVSNDVFDDDEPRTFDRDILHLPDCLLTEYGSTQVCHSAIRPAFDALWNAVGYPKSQFYSEDGVWTGSRQ